LKHEVSCEFIHANHKFRHEIIEQFRQNKLPILITTTILERGVTFEDIDVIVIDANSAIYNVAALVQIAGRVGRKRDYQNGKVIFVHTGVTKTMITAKRQIEMMNKLI
ncbi:MAG: helicase-related protein, partial [Mycoplasmatales bacterium]